MTMADVLPEAMSCEAIPQALAGVARKAALAEEERAGLDRAIAIAREEERLLERLLSLKQDGFAGLLPGSLESNASPAPKPTADKHPAVSAVVEELFNAGRPTHISDL